MGSLYNKVKVNNPGHSFFNLSYDKKFDCDMGQLIPFTCKFCMPNDVIKFGNEIVARMNPLVSPVMHEINVYTQYFFVPLRIMFGLMKRHSYPTPTGVEEVAEWEVNDHDFETFLTGGRTGYDTSVSLPRFFPFDPVTDNKRVNNDNYVHPIEHLDNGDYTNSVNIDTGEGGYFVRGQLYYYWDADQSKTVYFFTYRTDLEYSDGPQGANELWTPLYLNEVTSPVGSYSLWDYLDFPIGVDMSGHQPSAFPFRAYTLVWNNFFRDQNLMDEADVVLNCAVKNVCWNKDYFTAAYIDLQRGQSPALPLSNSLLPVVYKSGSLDVGGVGLLTGSSYTAGIGVRNSSNPSNYIKGDGSGGSVTPSSQFAFNVDASGLFNVNDLRLALRVQEWLETNQRVGTHLNEFLIGHFGVGPHDETLQRPVYLGGSKSPVIVSEVLQTSQTTEDSGDTKGSPQGNMAGHGITADRNFIGSYHCKEFGVFIGVMYIRPKATYQQGVERPWLYETKYDFPFPEFAHLGNQSILVDEIYASDSGYDEDGNPRVFAYTERYNELRSSQSKVSGGLRNMFDFWHLGRIFDNEPMYNADFVRCVPSKRIFAVETEPGFIVNVGNNLHFYRPLPYYGDPRT